MKKSIMIVAAERGLGLGLAQQFFKRGWDVVGTSRPSANVDELRKVGATDPDRLAVATIDVTDAAQIEPFLSSLGDRRFDVVFMNAGIWGAEHQSVLDATDQEFAEIMLTNTFGPIRLARHLLNHLVMPGGTLAFMSSHRGSIAINVEGGLELYRASKVACNMLARGIYAEYKERGLTVLSIHPGWVDTDMGTLGGTVKAEIGREPSVCGVADVVEKHMASGENLYLDYQDKRLNW